MKLVVSRFRTVGQRWFVAEKDERLSRLVGQPLLDAHSPLLTSWATREEACSYAAVVTRLLAAHPDRSLAEVRERARSIVRHG